MVARALRPALSPRPLFLSSSSSIIRGMHISLVPYENMDLKSVRYTLVSKIRIFFIVLSFDEIGSSVLIK